MQNILINAALRQKNKHMEQNQLGVTLTKCIAISTLIKYTITIFPATKWVKVPNN